MCLASGGPGHSPAATETKLAGGPAVVGGPRDERLSQRGGRMRKLLSCFLLVIPYCLSFFRFFLFFLSFPLHLSIFYSPI
jgi:hypothetical protein